MIRRQHVSIEKIGIPPLLPADIILVRHKKHFARRLLRRILGSYWDHAAMVIYPKDPARNLDHTVFMESIRIKSFAYWHPRGATMHLIHRYLNRPDLYDIGIKRVPHLTEVERRRVVTYMLMNVDAPYWPWETPMVPLAALFSVFRRGYLEKQRFGCSGMIQKSFYDSVPWERKRTVVFREGLWSPIELQELVSPADIARSPNAEWIYNER
jgi:hypothetical protein